MKNKIIFIVLALMLCMGIFYVPAFALEGDEPADAPYYAVEGEEYDQPADITDDEQDVDPEQPIVTESAIPIGSGFRPFTPPGTGTVVDNATDDDGKEFYTIMTEDGNVFFLIIDRQRPNDNVYFLNAVTEQDLISLAQQNGRTITGSTSGAIPPSNQPGTTGQDPSEPPMQEDDPPSNRNTGLFIILFVVVGVGGAAYYFKIVKGKKNAPDDDIYDENDEEDEYGYRDEPVDSDDDYGDEPDEGSEKE